MKHTSFDFRRWLPPIGFAMVMALLAASFESSRSAKSCATSHTAKLTALAIEAYHTAAEARAIADFGDRVIDLPEDGGAWHTTVFTSEQPTPPEQRLLAWFDSDPQLNRLKRQTHFHHYTPKSSVYERYGNLTAGGLPAVVLQDQTGKVVYKVSGANVPSAEWPLVKGVIECIRAHCPHCPRPNPTPAPAPTPSPSPVPDIGPPHIIPDVVGPNDNTPPDAKDDTLLVACGVFLIALIGSFIATARKDAVSALA
jgi:hypothetical protein